MNRERSLKIVRGHAALHTPSSAAAAGLTEAVAVVLSTYRSDHPDMVLDHELWLACMQTVGGAVSATSAEVYAKPNGRFLERLRRRRRGPLLGSLDTYGERLLGDQSPDKVDTDLWEIVEWRKEDNLVSAATREDWWTVGGPPLYHDSYTTSIFVRPADANALVKALETHAGRAGGWLEPIR